MQQCHHYITNVTYSQNFLTQWPHVLDWKLESELRSTSRSEEHTSELQSRVDLVCRLLLEKKNVPGYRRGSIRRNTPPYWRRITSGLTRICARRHSCIRERYFVQAQCRSGGLVDLSTAAL